MATFSIFIPSFSNKNPNIKYYAHFEDNLYYYCIDRKKHFVKITGSLYHKNFKEI